MKAEIDWKDRKAFRLDDPTAAVELKAPDGQAPTYVPADLMERRGRFVVSDPILWTDPIAVMAALSGVLVMMAEHNPAERLTTYWGVCDQWRAVGRGERVPAYVAEMTVETDGEGGRQVRLTGWHEI